MVRAKFKVNSILRQPTTKVVDGVRVDSEIWSIEMSPVGRTADPEDENSKFWQYTPSGNIRLGTVNADAVNQFDLNKEFYVDFTEAV